VSNQIAILFGTFAAVLAIMLILFGTIALDIILILRCSFIFCGVKRVNMSVVSLVKSDKPDCNSVWYLRHLLGQQLSSLGSSLGQQRSSYSVALRL
jgi:hypothetical protein